MHDGDTPGVMVRLSAVLSPEAMREALRVGKQPVESVFFDITPDDELWEPIAQLEVPLTGGWLLELPVNRRWDVRLAHPQPEPAHDQESSSPLEIWPKPRVETIWGEAEPIDTFPMRAADLVEFEQRRQSAWREACAAVQGRVDRLIPKWSNWMLRFLEHCDKQWGEWTAGGKGLTPSASPRAEHPDMVAFRQAYTSFDLIGDQAGEGADRLFAGTLAAMRAARGWVIEDEAKARKRGFNDQAEKWIRRHGSPRLRKALDLGVLEQSLGVYRDERLALEHPGWRWVTKGDLSSFDDILNPSEGELDMLAETRQWSPWANLRWQARRDDPLQGRSVVVAPFLDRQIMTDARRDAVAVNDNEEPV